MCLHGRDIPHESCPQNADARIEKERGGFLKCLVEIFDVGKLFFKFLTWNKIQGFT